LFYLLFYPNFAKSLNDVVSLENRLIVVYLIDDCRGRPTSSSQANDLEGAQSDSVGKDTGVKCIRTVWKIQFKRRIRKE